MTARMIAYSDPTKINDLAGFAPYLGDVHMCATDSLRHGVETFYQKERSVLTGRIVGAGLVMERLLDGWASPDTKLRQYAHLSELIDLLPKDDPVRGKRQVAFRRNQQDVLKTMRTLTEIGLTPDSVKPHAQTEEEKIFIQLWKQMEENNPDFRSIRKRMNVELENPKSLHEVLPDAIRSIPFGVINDDRPVVPDRIERVVLHGFYFITPLQHKFFSLLENAGIELVFVNLYDPRYQGTFESVRAFIKGWVPDDQNWHVPESFGPENTFGDLLARIFEAHLRVDTSVSPDQNTLQVLEYQDFYALLREYSAHPNSKDGEVEYFSPAHEQINERLKEYFPQNFKDRHLLSYPIGQFLFHLHCMWKEAKGKLILDERSLFECFASGWLTVGDKNARQYTLALRDLLPYFEGCGSLSQWRNRIDHLMKARRNVAGAFTRGIDAPPETKRFHEMMENPLLRFSFFKLGEEDMLVVFEMIEELLRIAEELFGDGKVRVTLADHFAKIDELLQKKVPESELLPLERDLIRFLKEQLMTERNAQEQFRLQDLSEALALYLGGDFNDDKQEERDDDPDNPNGRKIGKFEELDAAALLQQKRIHVVGLDEESLPYRASSVPWPLSRDCLEALAEQREELKTILLREQMAPQITRYLFYSLLAFHPQVTLSWMREWQGKELEESMYLALLGIKPKLVEDVFEEIHLDEQKRISGDVDEAVQLMFKYPSDARQEYQLCPRRFYYSFLTQDFATFREPFHHEFLFSNLVTVTAALTDREEEEAFQETSQLFPHWLNLKKQELREHALIYVRSVRMQFDRYDGSEYLRARERFQFLNTSYLRGKPRLTTEAFNQEVRHEDMQMESIPGEYCRYCPHLPQCPDGHYSADDR
ncbi:hypothetical protein OS242_17455 [Tumebacillus sp. DT12]|uniref:PD-(D/E)XK endonuclease-like domain-containing protein n=1 Tax=Tumebacillus lacus TaxID=2995335 RepID=A0ABT3X6X3_9BACL|nr:hypothetical protein [Tumebacillus lacus]MCX7571733.1 hypothetical protein [Tumebacillus lacus]